MLISTLLPLSVHCFAAFSHNTPQHLQSSARISLTSSPLAAIRTPHQQQRRHSQTRLFSSDDEEIAALEEKLRKLKEGGAAASAQSATEVETPSADKPDTASEQPVAEKRFKISDDSTNIMVTGEEPSRKSSDVYEELLSEQWKSRESNGIDRKDLLVKGGAVVATLLGLVAFSQVPIGQEDLDKYSTAKPSMAIDLGDLNPVGED